MIETNTNPWFLFIGGPLDGQHTATTGEELLYLMPAAPLATDKLISLAEPATYRKTSFFSEGVEYAVYVHGSVLDPLGMLIRGYKP